MPARLVEQKNCQSAGDRDRSGPQIGTQKAYCAPIHIASAKHGKLASFAAGVEADKAAVAAAIVEPWSSGQVEGKINQLKLIKRQMYGRANLDLLKARLMAAA